MKLINGGTAATQAYIEVPYHRSLVPGTGITLEAWLTYDDATLQSGWRWPTIARLNPLGQTEAYWLRVDAGNTGSRTLAWGVRTSSGLTRCSHVFASGELQKWTHVAGTFDGAVQILYVNGVEKARYSFVGPVLLDQGGVLRIGNGDTVAPIEAWHGELDEVRMWPFARSAAEIQSTMQLALSSVPGLVSTWNLDFSPRDSSGGNAGTDINQPTYAPNSLRLTVVPTIGAVGFGAGTPGCAGTPAAGVTAYARAASAAFALTCVGGAAGPGATAFLWLGLGRLNSGISLAGAAMWVDPLQPGLLVPVAGDANGLYRIPAGIPAVLPGIQVHGQFFFHQSGCAVPIFSSSGLTVTVQ